MNFLFTLATILYCFFTIGTTAPQHARGKVLKHKKLRHPLFSFGLFVFGTLTACYIVSSDRSSYSDDGLVYIRSSSATFSDFHSVH